MSEGRSPTAKRGRGRPKIEANSQVVDKLLQAAELLLQKHGHLNATERKIAEAAGVNEAMIHYYFGGKDGLLFDLVDRLAAGITDEFSALHSRTDWHQANPTRHLVKVLIDSYYAKPWIARMMLSEATRDNSVMRGLFMQRYGPRGLVEIKRVLDVLVECGIYDRKVNTTYAALSLFSLIIGPLSLTLLSGESGIALDDLHKDGWIDHVTDLFDRQLRQPVSD